MCQAGRFSDAPAFLQKSILTGKIPQAVTE
jgi:hypothetical protein